MAKIARNKASSTTKKTDLSKQTNTHREEDFEIIDTIKNALLTKKTLLYLDTKEEERAINLIKRAIASAEQSGVDTFNLFSFDSFAGLLDITTAENEEYLADNDHKKCLSTVLNLFMRASMGPLIEQEIQQQSDDNDLLDDDDMQQDMQFFNENSSNALILKDFNRLNEPANPVHMRTIRTVVSSINSPGKLVSSSGKVMKPRYCPIIIMGQGWVIPADIRMYTEKIFIGYPKYNDAYTLINAMLNSLQKYNVEHDAIEELTKASLGLTQLQIVNALKEEFKLYNKITVDFLNKKKVDYAKQSNSLDFLETVTPLEDVGGNENVKKYVTDTKFIFDHKDTYPGKLPKGYLSTGVPGTGKTFTAGAMAKHLNVPFLRLNMSKILGGLVGLSESNLASALETAESLSPCVLLIDEVEKTLSGSGSSNKTDGGTTDRIFGMILQFMEKNNGVVSVLTANDVTKLPPELSRTGRIDEIFFHDLPKEEERKSILNIHINKVFHQDLDSMPEKAKKYLIDKTRNYTGAELAQVVQNMLKFSFIDSDGQEKGLEEISNNVIAESIASVTPVSKFSAEKIAHLKAWGRTHAKPASREEAVDVKDKINKFKV